MRIPAMPSANGMALLFAVLNIVALLFLPGLKANDDYRLLLKTNDEQFERYLRYQESFGAHENDVVVVLQGDVLGGPALANLQQVSAALVALDAVQSVGSVWSIPWVSRNAQALLDGDRALLAELTEKLASSTYVPAKLVSKDHQTMLMTVTLNADITQSTGNLVPVVKQLRAVLDSSLEQSLRYNLAGYPTLRADIKTQTDRDAALFGALSILFALIVATFMLRRFALVSIALLVPLSAVVCTLGVMSALGVYINLLNQMVVVLVLAITFSDLMHVVRHIKSQQLQKSTVSNTIQSCYRVVVPACLMTTLTTATGFASLLLADSSLVRQFGWVSALAIIIGFVLLIIALPFLVRMIYRFDRSPYKERLPFASLSATYDQRLITGFIVLLVVLIWLSVQVRADYQLGENLPENSEVRVAMNIADRELGGLIPFSVMLEWPAEVKLKRRLSDIRRLQLALRENTELRWMSVLDLMRFSRGFNSTSRFELLPVDARERLYSKEHSVALLVTQLPVLNAATLQATTEELMQIVNGTLAGMQVNTAEPAGLLPLIAQAGQTITNDLLKSLACTFLVVSALMLLILRSVRLGLLLMLPNVLPLAAVAALLVLTGSALHVATVVVFSVCLGIVVDDSIHMIMRYQQHRYAGLSIERAIDKTVSQVGSVLVHTTLIICAGFLVLLFSNTPAVQSIGVLCLIAVPSALLVDLLVLPPLIRTFAP